MMCADCPYSSAAPSTRTVCCVEEAKLIEARAVREQSNWERAQEEAELRRQYVGPLNRHERRKRAAIERRR